MSYAIRAENAELKEELALLRKDYAAGLRRANSSASVEPTE